MSLKKFREMAESLKIQVDEMEKEEALQSINLPDKEANSFKAKISERFSSSKDAFKDFSVIGKIKDFSTRAVDMVAELDEHLNSSNSAYEVGDFRVNANLGVVAGMSLDIRFIKTQTARSISQSKSQFLSITNPQTGKEFKVGRVSLAGKAQAKVRDPETKDILLIETKTGNVISMEKGTPTEEENPKSKEDNEPNQDNSAVEAPENNEVYLKIINPSTKKSIKILREKLKGRKQASIKDPNNGDVLTFETETGKIFSYKKAGK